MKNQRMELDWNYLRIERSDLVLVILRFELELKRKLDSREEKILRIFSKRGNHLRMEVKERRKGLKLEDLN